MLDIKPLLIDAKVCKAIRNQLTDRVAQIVIEAIYTVTDAAIDFPSRHVVEPLLPAASKLIVVAQSERRDFEGYSPINTIAVSLFEAETLLRATRQRLAGLPVTREFSRLPFELPPPGVRIYIDTIEFLSDSLIRHFKNDYPCDSPYVIIDTVDGPKHSLLAIRMPEHRLDDVSVYTAVSHEAFHALMVFNNSFLLKTHAIDFMRNGKTISYKTNELDRNILLDELCVELLDFEFSYLGNYLEYMEDEWTFFSRHFKESIKADLKPRDIVHYILRTFVIKLWFLLKDDLSRQSARSIVNFPNKLRHHIREHMCAARRIAVKEYEKLGSVILDSIVVLLQHDLEEICDPLEDIFSFVSDILEKKGELLQEIKEYRDSESTNELVEDILRCHVENRPIMFPHIIVLNVARSIRKRRFVPEEERNIARSLVLNMWNAYNWDKEHRS